MADIVEVKHEYKVGDAVFEAVVCYDKRYATTKRPAIIISHAFFGRSSFEISKARKLAELGYVGFALDLYGKGVLGKNRDECMVLMMPLRNDRHGVLKTRLKASLDECAALPMVDADKICAIGYCFGGLCVLDMARYAWNVRAVVSLHGGLEPLDDTSKPTITAGVLVLHGYDDPMGPPEKILALMEELRRRGCKDYQLHVYGLARHSFTYPPAVKDAPSDYDPIYNARSWHSMLTFIQEYMGKWVHDTWV